MSKEGSRGKEKGMMQDECNKPTTHMTKLKKHGRRLKLRSWGVTTLHHYKRILSRDLGWHQREMEEEEKR